MSDEKVLETVLRRFGVGPFITKSKRTVHMRSFVATSGARSFSLTVPRDLIGDEELERKGLFEVGRDADGNFIFKRIAT